MSASVLSTLGVVAALAAASSRRRGQANEPDRIQPVKLTRDAVIYFELTFWEDNLIYDLEEAKAGDEERKVYVEPYVSHTTRSRLSGQKYRTEGFSALAEPDSSMIHRAYFDAIRVLQRELDVTIYNEGFDERSALFCKFHLGDNLKKYEKVYRLLHQMDIGSADDDIEIEDPLPDYFRAYDWKLYPRGLDWQPPWPQRQNGIMYFVVDRSQGEPRLVHTEEVLCLPWGKTREEVQKRLNEYRERD